MTTRNLPGSDAARHGTGDADLTIMLAAHGALRRDLERLARSAQFADLPDPGGRASRRNGLSAGGEMFAWMADGAEPDQAAAVVGTLPPPARLVYRAIWRPRYARTSRW